MSEYRFGDHPGKDPAETIKVVLNCFNMCAVFWRADEQVSAGEYMWPLIPNGLTAECTTLGRTGFREPRWPSAAGLTVTDGTVVWTMRAAGITNGVNALTSPSAVSDPTGITVSSVTVSESTKILATYADGTEGNTYDVVFTFTLDGVSRVARQRVPVLKR